MYKLLTTAAVIMAVATPSFAWNGAETLIENLNTVYKGVDGAGVETDQSDGSSHFTNLSNAGGELNTFLSDVNKGVTHITLEVLGDNTIVPTLNEGKTLAELNDSAGNLVNRINYDLFYDATSADGNDDGYDNGVGYDSTADYTITNDEATTASYIDHTTDILNLGLVGNKVNDIVTDVDTINLALINAPGTTQEELDAAALANSNFIKAYNGDTTVGDTHYGVNVTGFLEDITEINTSITAAGGADFFSNTAGIDVDNTNLNNFALPGFTFVDNGVTDGTNTYNTLLEWAEAQP